MRKKNKRTNDKYLKKWRRKKKSNFATLINLKQAHFFLQFLFLERLSPVFIHLPLPIPSSLWSLRYSPSWATYGQSPVPTVVVL